MGSKERPKSGDLSIKCCGSHAKEDDTGMGKLLPEDEFTKVTVTGYKDTSLTLRNLNHLSVRKRMRVMMRYSCNVMSLTSKPRRQAELDAFI